MAYVFGPVASRRLGRSLGVDLIPYKTCPYDCIYCQLGTTTQHTLERRAWSPIETILQELDPKLALRPDYVTLGGSGEPTLHQDLGLLIRRIKAMTDIPVAVLTNGALLWREEVRGELLPADLVCPSLDAGDEQTFKAVNQPCEGLSFADMLEGLIAFRQTFRGQFWLEVLLVAGHSGDEASVRKIAACAARIRPDRVQLNTVTRPPAHAGAQSLSMAEMQAFAELFSPAAEVIAEFRDTAAQKRKDITREEVLDMIRRHPCALEDIAGGLGAERPAVAAQLDALAAQDLIETYILGETTQYRAVRSQEG